MLFTFYSLMKLKLQIISEVVMSYGYRHAMIIGRFILIILVTITAMLSVLAPCSFTQDEATQKGAEQKTTTGIPEKPSLSKLLTQTVIFLYGDNTPENSEGVVLGNVLGTAFIVGIPQPGKPTSMIPIIITAKHVIANRSRVLGRYTPKSGTEPLYVRYDLESLRKNGDLWEHPTDEGVDIVAFRTLVYDDVKMVAFPISLIASKDIFKKKDIDVTDRIIIPCLMTNYPGVSQNFPIFRDGSIALITEEPVTLRWNMGDNTVETEQMIIFVNATLNEGFSGAPVLMWPGMRLTPQGITLGGKSWLIGIVHGFFPNTRCIIDEDGDNVIYNKPSKDFPLLPPREVNVYSQENPGTGIIFPSWRLLDILQSEEIKKRVQQITDEEVKTKSTKKKD